MKIYLAGPMRGYPEFNFPRFHQEAQLLRSMGHEVLNPAEEDLDAGFDPEGLSGDENLSALGFDLRAALASDLAWICREAEAVVVLPRWYRSSGAKAEVALARALGIPALYVSYDGDGKPSLEEVPIRASI